MKRDYFLGMAPEEVARLAHQHRAWARQTVHLWDVAAIGPGDRVVDLGCGPGFTSLDLARRVGVTGRVIAVDPSGRALDELRRAVAHHGLTNVECVESLEAELDLAAFRPTVVFARWVYWFLPEVEASVRRVSGALGPGGRIVIMDYGNYLGIGTEPPSALFARVFRAVYDSVEAGGGSLDIAGRLPGICRRCGLDVTILESLTEVARPGEPIWTWLTTFQDLHLPALVERGYLTAAEVDAMRAWWSTLSRQPDAVFFAPPMVGLVGVRQGRSGT